MLCGSLTPGRIGPSKSTVSSIGPVVLGLDGIGEGPVALGADDGLAGPRRGTDGGVAAPAALLAAEPPLAAPLAPAPPLKLKLCCGIGKVG
jgi:hypothetical protein